MKTIVILTGAGISAESGIQTFRDSNGLWEGHDWRQVASPEGWAADQAMVLKFYNLRRAAIRDAQPNAGHLALVELEKYFQVFIITQNIDDLHERAGSRNILHLHGEIRKARSTSNPKLVYDLGDKDIEMGDLCEEGSQLRPHIVWFGEDVPLIHTAAGLCYDADLIAVVGTSMVVYPAAGLVNYAKKGTKLFMVDPNKPEYSFSRPVEYILEPASTGVPKLVGRLKEFV
ncbi:MAG: NAD-dependent deacylase [Bacteroidia bacterium]|nr:NAD-dependent deacylase [Bacteroidia bacterium]